MAVKSLLTWALACCIAAVAGQTTTEIGGNPIEIAFNLTDPIGPDGPWWAIRVALDFPRQHVSMLPSLASLPVAIRASACENHPSNCPSPVPGLWEPGDVGYEANDGNETFSELQSPSEWSNTVSQLLGMQGEGAVFRNRITLDGDIAEPGAQDSTYLVVAVMLSDSYAATYPGGASYTLDTGFFSLYGAEDNFSWTAQNGTTVNFNATLPAAHYVGGTPSISYGLHVGNVAHNVTPSLILGGYDGSRYLAEPLVFDANALQLERISVNVSSGDSAYVDALPGSSNLLQNDQGSFHANIEPALPYMYLPRATCDAIAAQLPVTYSKDYNLYLWNTGVAACQAILTSPHYLAFTFVSGEDGSTPVTISVPFAVLNLALTHPLANVETPYFPCSPLDNAGEVYLGRAFLQAAYLVQNWQTDTVFLAQAPGPSIAPSNVRAIGPTDSLLDPVLNQQDWADTWAGVLTPYSRDSSADPGSTKEEESLSGGSIAGIVVGVIGGLAIVGALAFWMVRRRRTRPTPTEGEKDRADSGPVQSHAERIVKKPNGNARVEMDADKPVRELDGKAVVTELDASKTVRELDADGPR